MKRILGLCLGLLATLSGAATLSPITLLNPSGSTAGQAIVSTGPTSAPVWGAVSADSLAPISANTVLGNFIGASSAPLAYPVPNCSTANSALKYTSGTGLSCGTTFALTSGNLSQFASTTSAQLSTLLSDETGSGGVAVFSASPALTGTPTAPTAAAGNSTTQIATTAFLTQPGPIGSGTANTGRFTTLQATGAITPSSTAGIVGTTTNDNANVGSIGEYQSATTTNTSLTNGASANITSISLTAGDWDVEGSGYFHPAGSTTITGLAVGISLTSATLDALGSLIYMQTTFNTGSGNYLATPRRRISLSATTTIYLVGFSNFGVSTMQADGFIRARRVR